MTSISRRLAPWLRAVVLVYLLCAVTLTTVHQHHATAQGGDCALCTLAHTPAIMAPTTHQPTPATAFRSTLPIRDERVREAEFRQASRSRAPPQA